VSDKLACPMIISERISMRSPTLELSQLLLFEMRADLVRGSLIIEAHESYQKRQSLLEHKIAVNGSV
jgi:hypothetical protein